MRWRAEHEPSTHWRHDYARMGPPLLLTWRQSPRRMAPGTGSRVSAEDPPQTVSGMVSIAVDGLGRLNAFTAIPPQLDSSTADAAPAHTAEMFALAGLDTAAFHEVPPVWTPLPAYQARREWLGSAAWLPGVPLRVCAAWWRERPVSFVVLGPWSRPVRMGTTGVVNQNPIAAVTVTLLSILMIVLGLTTGRSRLKAGRGDWRGGLRLAGVMIIVRLLRWAVYAHHNLDLGSELDSFAFSTAFGILQAFVVFFLYLAVEPQVRRRTPELLVGWARVLQERFTDPRVGRDVLVGALFGTASVLVLYVVNALPTWIPFHAQTPIPSSMDALLGGRVLLGALFSLPTDILVTAFTLFGLWFLLRLLFRRALPAAIGLAVIMTLLALGAENQVLELPGALLQGVLVAWVISRHGLLAIVSMWLMRALLLTAPLPFAPTAPYAFQTVLCLGLVVVMLATSFRVSLGGRPALSLSLDE
jgi:hypothetical protein